MSDSFNRYAHGFVTVTLTLAALGFIAFGIQWMLVPVTMAKPLGIVLTNGDATSDARAVYGGMELGVGFFMAWCALSRERRIFGLTVAVSTLAGLGTTRLVGILLESSHVGSGTWQLLATDLGGTLLATTALVTAYRTKKSMAVTT